MGKKDKRSKRRELHADLKEGDSSWLMLAFWAVIALVSPHTHACMSSTMLRLTSKTAMT